MPGVNQIAKPKQCILFKNMLLFLWTFLSEFCLQLKLDLMEWYSSQENHPRGILLEYYLEIAI